MPFRENWPCLAYCATLVLLLVIGFVAADSSICSEGAVACLRSFGNIAGPTAIAVLTVVIGFGQFYAGQRQAKSAEAQARFAAIPLLDNEILATQFIASFAMSLDAEFTYLQRRLNQISEAFREGISWIDILQMCQGTIKSFEDIDDLADDFLEELKDYITPEQASKIQTSIIEIGKAFNLTTNPCSYYMGMFIDGNGNFTREERDSAFEKLKATEISIAVGACAKALAALASAEADLTKVAGDLRAKRNLYLGPLAKSSDNNT
jgi:hypothetical protein